MPAIFPQGFNTTDSLASLVTPGSPSTPSATTITTTAAASSSTMSANIGSSVPGSGSATPIQSSPPAHALMQGLASASDAAKTTATSVATQPVRLMLSCDNCRRKKIRCNGGKPSCESCLKSSVECHYSPVGPRKKPRRNTSRLGSKTVKSRTRSKTPEQMSSEEQSANHRTKRRALSQTSDGDDDASGAMTGLGSVSHLMLEGIREVNSLEFPQGIPPNTAGSAAVGSSNTQTTPVMEMLRLQSQISALVDQLRTITIRASGLTPTNTPLMSPAPASINDSQPLSDVFSHYQNSGRALYQHQMRRDGISINQNTSSSSRRDGKHSPSSPRLAAALGCGTCSDTCNLDPKLGHVHDMRKNMSDGCPDSAPIISPTPLDGQSQHGGDPNTRSSASNARGPDQSAKTGPLRGINASRDLINHLISVYFKYYHPSETGMHPIELYMERLQRAQVSEPFLLSVLAVASRMSDDPRVKREPVYLAGYDFFERVTRGLMMDVLERDCVENMLTLNNLAIYAVGLPVANRSWYFSGMAMRMATQMSLQKVDAPGRMPGASMMSGPGLESARRAFWTTLLLEALASFASGEPPPVTIQDIHVAEPYDDPSILDDDTAASSEANSAGVLTKALSKHSGPGQKRYTKTDQRQSERTRSGSISSNNDGTQRHGNNNNTNKRSSSPNVCAYISQLSLLLIRVARLNGNRHPESTQFSPEYAALHTEMVAWYHGLPDNMQVKPTVAKEEIKNDPQLFAAKMFVHCIYHAAIIALHQPRVDLVRVDSGGTGNNRSESESDQQWRQLAQQQCLTAACNMTEYLAIARNLDVRYHLVTFGFAVFMAGVVHVGAVACTPKGSNERQYSINCVKEHVKCLDRLGIYFAFHYIMAKHIRAQMQAIENLDLRRQNDVNAAAAAAAAAVTSFPGSVGTGLDVSVDAKMQSDMLGVMAPASIDGAQKQSMGFQFPFSQTLTSASSLQAASSGALSNFNIADLSLGPDLINANIDNGSSSNAWANYNNTSNSTSNPDNINNSSGASASFGCLPNNNGLIGNTPLSSESPMDIFVGIFGPPQPLPEGGGSGPRLDSSIGLGASHFPGGGQSGIFGMSGILGMSGLGSDVNSLAELFASTNNGNSSLYPEKMLNSSTLAPARENSTGGVLASRTNSTNIMANQTSVSSALNHHTDPSTPLHLTSPGGFQQYGSLPPF